MNEEKIISSYKKLLSVDVKADTKKKGRFDYLSWANALHLLQREYPGATWETKRFDGMPYLKTELGFFVEVSVTVEYRELSQLHPVLDNKNQPIPKPTTFQINTSIQRCLAKAIALHGLGLCLFAGEDLVYLDEISMSQGIEKKRIASTAFTDIKDLDLGLSEELKALADKCGLTESALTEKMKKREPKIRYISDASKELQKSVFEWLSKIINDKGD